jgi:hypothetical protein
VTEDHLRRRRAFATTNRWVFDDESRLVLRDTGDVAWLEPGAPHPVRQASLTAATACVLGNSKHAEIVRRLEFSASPAQTQIIPLFQLIAPRARIDLRYARAR